jgi:hypothetical protein
MTFEEMEQSVKELRDNQIVQGHRLARTETNLDRLVAIVEQNTQAIARNTQGIARNSEAIGKVADAMLSIQAAVLGLTETVDRFIRGLGEDGHHNGPEEGQ